LIPDSHAHLDLIEQDTGEVVAAAVSAGVSPIITIGITIDSSIEAVRAASSFEEVFAAVGIHPNDTAAAAPGQFERLEELASSSDRVVAIGESGLDYYRDRTPTDVQKRALREHIRIARELGKALIIHDRQAHRDVLEILAEGGGARTPVVMHCFSGGADVLEECISRGYYVSFAGPLTFKKSEETRRMASLAPLDRLLVETDSPFLSPHPFRGKPNLPERARLVAEAMAGARGVPLEEMECVLVANTARAFGITIPEG
jgi:TatD DNase family protein